MRLIMLLCLFVSVFSFCYSDTITIVADEWLPYTGSEKDQNGYLLEIAKTIFAKHGHTVVYKNVPWSRAVDEAAKGQYTAIAGGYRSDAPDFIYPANEQGYGVDAFFVLNDSTWTFKDVSSLTAITLGTIQDYSYGEDIDAYITKYTASGKVNALTGTDNLTMRLIQMLQQKKISAFLENRNVFNYTVKKNSITGIKEAGARIGAKIYIAFSPKNQKSTEYAKILSDGMAEIRSSGELKKILDKYGLKDWK